MKRFIFAVLIASAAIAEMPAFAQVKTSRDEMMFYTSGWTGERFPDGRPKVPDDLLRRVINCSFEDIWGYMRSKGFNNQFAGGDWKFLHLGQPFSGRAVTAQYMPLRPDMQKPIDAEGKAEGRIGGSLSWPIDELTPGDVYVADNYDKIEDGGPIIGSNLGNSIYAHSHTGFVFEGAIRDEEENREIKGFNGIYRSYDPSGNGEMAMTKINGPLRIGRATVLPGDLVLVKDQGVLFIPAEIAETAIVAAEFTSVRDAFGFAMLQQKKYTPGEIDKAWTPQINAAFVQYVNEHPELLKDKMSRSAFDALLQQQLKR